MSEIKQVWGIIKNYQCADLKMVQDPALAVFQHQQAIIDQLNSVLEERTKEWLQAIELGTYFENAAKPLKEENDSLRVQLSLQRDRNKALETELTKSRNYGDDLHRQLNNMETCYIEKKKEVELQGQLNKHSECIENLVNQKADYLDRVTKAIAHLGSFDLSQAGMNKLQRSIESALEALRGGHD